MLHLLHYSKLPYESIKKDTNLENIEKYLSDKIISPLSLALKSGNGKYVEILLKYMSKIEKNASFLFMSLFPELV